MKTSRILTGTAFLIYGAAALVPSTFPRLFPHQHAPAWLRYTTAGVLSIPLVALAGLIAAGLVKRFAGRTRTRQVVREVPASNGIQVLGAFLSEDLRAFDRQYSIVRQIHGDDIASRLTREQIEAEYDRYDRAETAASEDRCQRCDPTRVPADLLVEAWDEQPGHDRHIGEWLLCVSHAETKIRNLRSTGAQVVSEPMTAGYVDELAADHYGQGGVR